MPFFEFLKNAADGPCDQILSGKVRVGKSTGRRPPHQQSGAMVWAINSVSCTFVFFNISRADVGECRARDGREEVKTHIFSRVTHVTSTYMRVGSAQSQTVQVVYCDVFRKSHSIISSFTVFI